MSWRGVLVLTDPRSFFEAHRSTRNPKTRVLHACLSTDKDTKEVSLGESLSSSKMIKKNSTFPCSVMIDTFFRLAQIFPLIFDFGSQMEV